MRTMCRRIGLVAGLVDVKVCAVNEVWSGLKFVPGIRALIVVHAGSWLIAKLTHCGPLR